MSTVTIQIGNSDNKLSQVTWSEFVLDTSYAVEDFASSIYFYGCSPSDKPWQNACWVIEVDFDGYNKDKLVQSLKNIRYLYGQDSIAWTEGLTQFI